MSENKIAFSRIVDGKATAYSPKDKNGEVISPSVQVVMPEPNNTDSFQIGGWIGTVEDVRDVSGNLVVADQEGEIFEVEPSRVELF